MDKKEDLKTKKRTLIPTRASRFRHSFYFLRYHACCMIIASAFFFQLLACGNNQSPKFNQYYVHGEKLYVRHCSNCHQKDGTGLGRVYPPVNTSAYMDNNFEQVICLIKFGKEGELIVNGREFNQPMKGISTLSDLEIAEIATYIYNTWSHERGLVEVRDVSKILAGCDPKLPTVPRSSDRK
jgi:cytochrome c551